ncbi:MAG TPA: DUF6029 family protein [Draconibacterium sp.]|nr:DUF6029 family protein [Draconibacterium sp.]
MNLKSTVFILLFTGTFIKGNAQFSGNNIAEYQLGNIPGATPAYVNSIYDQFNLEYRYKNFKAFGRLENFYSTDSTRIHYTKITQYSLSYQKKGLDFKAGHFYETLGKGLLFRGYEIKNSIYEDQIYRIKQGFYRDTRGVSGSYSNKYFQVKGLWGKPLINQLPITDPNNRLDLVTATEANLRFLKQTAGFIWMQNENETEISKYISTYLGGNIFDIFDYYGEFAFRTNEEDYSSDKETDQSYGAYFNLSYSSPGFGVSFELKDYQNLFIGSGISDPPTLVKEHIYKLLNRSTHVPYYFDESGMQVELFLAPAENHLITLNHSRSKNELGTTAFKSFEYFADWQFTTQSLNQFKIFADFSSEELLNENARYATGIYYTRTLQKNWSFSIETEFQQIERTYSETEKFQNIYTGFILNYSPKFSAAIIWEYTNDPNIADNPQTETIEKAQHYPGINFSVKPNRKHTIQLFAGKRRGGPACTSGICYEVLDFKGLEIRWSYRF